MKRKVVLCSIASLMTISMILTGCSGGSNNTQPVTEGYTLFTQTEAGEDAEDIVIPNSKRTVKSISYTEPAGWKFISDHKDGSTKLDSLFTMLYSTPGANHYISVLINDSSDTNFDILYPTDTSKFDHLRDDEPSPSSLYSDYVAIDEPEETYIDGHPALKRLYRFKDKYGGTKGKDKVYIEYDVYLSSGTLQFQLSWNCKDYTKESFKSGYVDDFEDMMKTVKIKDTAPDTSNSSQTTDASPIDFDMKDFECGHGEYGWAEGHGVIKNIGNETLYFVKMKIKYIDDAGNVVKTDSTYAVGDEGISPGDSQYFEWATTDFKGDFSKYSVSVLDYKN